MNLTKEGVNEKTSQIMAKNKSQKKHFSKNSNFKVKNLKEQKQKPQLCLNFLLKLCCCSRWLCFISC